MFISKSKGKRRFAAADPAILEDIALQQAKEARLIAKELRKWGRAGQHQAVGVFTGTAEIQRYISNP